MDPLSISASIIAVLQVSGSLISTCYEYRRLLRNKSHDVQLLIQQLSALRTVLENLLEIVDVDQLRDKPRLRAIASLTSPNGILENCQNSLEGLETKLKPKKGWRATRDKILWPLGEKEVRAQEQEIQRMVADLKFAMAVDQTSTLVSIQDEVSRMNITVKDLQSEQMNERVFTWLGGKDVSRIHSDLLRKAGPRTGEWFVKSKQIETWRETPSSLFCLYGIPGCGKSVLCAKVIQHLQQECKTTAGSALAFFYFDFNDNENRRMDVALRSLIRQFSYQIGSTPKEVSALYRKSDKSQHHPAASALCDVLLKLTLYFDKAYIVMDALDEGEDIQEIATVLKRLQTRVAAHVHILVTSRELVEVQKTLADVKTHEFRLEGKGVDSDIQLYIQNRLENDQNLRHFPTEQIGAMLTRQANGMFKWIECQLDNLAKCMTLRDVQHELESLPASLDETYERILTQVPPLHKEKLHKLLRWLIFAARPVSLEELDEVMAVDHRSQCYDAASKLMSPEQLFQLGAGLIIKSYKPTKTSAPFRFMRENNDYSILHVPAAVEAKLSHASVKDFLVSSRILDGPVSSFYMDYTLSNAFMAETCLIYLLHEPFSQGYCKRLSSLESLVTKWPLLHYSAFFWTYHATALKDKIPNSTMKLAFSLFKTKDMARCANYGLWGSVISPTSPTAVKGTAPLYYAASFGMVEVVKAILATEGTADLNKRGGRNKSTPVQVAAYRGREEVIKVLLKEQPSFEWVEESVGGALYLGLFNYTSSIPRMLIEGGATLSTAELKRLKSARHARRCWEEFGPIVVRDGDKVKGQVVYDVEKGFVMSRG